MELLFYTIILTPSFVCLFWMAVLLLGVKSANIILRRRLPEQVLMGRRRLAFFMAVAATLYICHATYYAQVLTIQPLMNVIYAACNQAVYPLFLLYISTLAGECAGFRTLLHWRWNILLLPSLLRLLIGIALLLADIEPTASLYVTIRFIDKVFFLIVMLISVVLCIRIMQRHDKKIANYYADIEGKTMEPFRLLLLLMIVCMAGSIISLFLGRAYFAEKIWLLILPSLLFSSTLFLIGFEGMRWNIQEPWELPTDAEPDRSPESEELVAPEQSEDDPKPENAESTTAAGNQLYDRVVEVLRQQHLYLQPNLKITDLTRLLGTNRTYLYQAINVERGLSFSELVNRLRVEHAVQLMRRSPEALLDEIAVQSGFSSSASFYRNFRQFQGCSPREFLLRLAT